MPTNPEPNSLSIQSSDIVFLYASEGIVISDEQGKIVKVNPAGAQLFGYTQQELLGQVVEILVPHRMMGQHKTEREQFHERPHVRSFGQHGGVVGLRKDGTEVPLQISLSPVQVDGKNYVISFVVDDSYRVEAETQLRAYADRLEKEVAHRTLILQEAVDQLEHTKQELSQALTKEKELNHLKSRFVSIASHEFRTPLATILSSLSLVRKYADMGDQEKRNKHIERIKSSIGTLSDTLDDFLSLSKVEEGLVENHPVAFDILGFCHELVEELRPSALDHQNIVIRHEGGTIVELDPKPLHTVLTNLLSNAIKYSPDYTTIQLDVRLSEGSLEIVLCDQGIGIPREDMEHISERFFRAQNVMHIKGSGLGLNIVSRFVEVMHGSLHIESTENEGTCVTLHFPQ